MLVDVDRISIYIKHDPPMGMITDHMHCTNYLAKNRNKLYPCNIGHVDTWCNNDCVSWWVKLYVKVSEWLNLNFLPRRKGDQRSSVACRVSHLNNFNQVSVLLPVILLLIPNSTSYHFLCSFNSHSNSLIKFWRAMGLENLVLFRCQVYEF